VQLSFFQICCNQPTCRNDTQGIETTTSDEAVAGEGDPFPYAPAEGVLCVSNGLICQLANEITGEENGKLMLKNTTSALKKVRNVIIKRSQTSKQQNCSVLNVCRVPLSDQDHQ